MTPRRRRGAPAQQQSPQTVDVAAIYRRVRQITDEDALHHLIARYGPEILKKGLPYVVVAARNWQRSAHRRSVAHPEVELTDAPAGSVWDPYEQLAQKEGLRTVNDALAQLGDEDFLVVWRHAEGVSDDAIRDEWTALGFTPTTPTVEYIRKRRQRARERLRDILLKAGAIRRDP